MNQLTAVKLKGVYTALVTPMLPDGTLDQAAWRRLVQQQITTGIMGLVVAGTTGESAVLSDTEFAWLVSRAVEVCQGSGVQVIAQTGSVSPEVVIQRNRLAASLGAQAALVVTPYYLRTTQKGLLEHFLRIADVSELPLILYNVPARTANDMKPETTAVLSQHPRIIGIKEAVASDQRFAQLRCETSDFAVLSGDDGHFFAAMRHGASGVISVAANARPKTVSVVAQQALAENWTAAEMANQSLHNLYDLMTYAPNPMPVKWCLHRAGVIEKGIRLPLVWPSEPPDRLNWRAEIELIQQEYRS